VCGSRDPADAVELVRTFRTALDNVLPAGADGSAKRRYEIAPGVPREASEVDEPLVAVAAPALPKVSAIGVIVTTEGVAAMSAATSRDAPLVFPAPSFAITR
jgi:hypothetical protein